jgi:DNA-binding NtrC family response regulator
MVDDLACSMVVVAPYLMRRSMDLPPPRTLLLAFEYNALATSFGGMLHGAGYDVFVATDMEAARPMVEAHASDLLLLEVARGADAVVHLAQNTHATTPSCPVTVIVSWWDTRPVEVASCTDALVYMPQLSDKC